MKIIGCDLHARQQTLAMLDTETGEIVNLTLRHEGDHVREFYSKFPRPVRVGIEATGSMQWFLNLMEELGIECQVGHPANIRAAEPRKQKHDRRDADLILKLLVENRFPSIWLPSKELLDLYTVISGYGCERECRTRCRPLPWQTGYGEVRRYGVKQDKTSWRLCRWPPTRRIDGVSCKPCTRSLRWRSKN
jgi:transposase